MVYLGGVLQPGRFETSNAPVPCRDKVAADVIVPVPAMAKVAPSLTTMLPVPLRLPPLLMTSVPPGTPGSVVESVPTIVVPVYGLSFVSVSVALPTFTSELLPRIWPANDEDLLRRPTWKVPVPPLPGV